MSYLTNITQYFDETAASFPDHAAVYDGDREISFAQLYGLVLAAAHGLHKRLKGRTGKIIAVSLPKSLETIVADLAILYSGNAYMNLDDKAPPQRALNICAQTQPAMIISGDKNISIPGYDDRIMRLELDALLPLADADKTALLAIRDKLIDTDLLCIINTSGSTGTPKAVALNHRSFIDFTEIVREAGLAGEKEVIGSLSPAIFDIFSFELCMLMAYASSIVIIPKKLASFPLRMLELMAFRKVSFIFWVPTIMVNIANMKLLDRVNLPDLKMIWFAGEVFPTSKFNYWRKSLPNATFANFYGPIEITLDCLYHVVDRPLRDDEPIPIGKPFRNTSVLILDENNRPATEGELCIRGSSLAMGYYNDPQKTASAFTQNPLNTAYPETVYRTGDIVSVNEFGEMLFRGRKDTLIKHLGYRIELTEIEHVAVNVLHLVDNCCVLHDAAQNRIVMVYEAQKEIDEKQLRLSLGTILPRHMIPALYLHTSSMPRNPNGKIDRAMIRDSVINRNNS